MEVGVSLIQKNVHCFIASEPTQVQKFQKTLTLKGLNKSSGSFYIKSRQAQLMPKITKSVVSKKKYSSHFRENSKKKILSILP